jgi:hypothetical protein
MVAASDVSALILGEVLIPVLFSYLLLIMGRKTELVDKGNVETVYRRSWDIRNGRLIKVIGI